MDSLKIIGLLNAAGYSVKFATLPDEKDLKLPALPSVAISWEGMTIVTRGVDAGDALRGASRYLVEQVEATRIAELKRRGSLHAELMAELAKG